MSTGSTRLQYSSIKSNEFTSALSMAANGVTIVTTDGVGGKAGLTVSSMCSVCAEPPVILVCVNHDNEFCTAITDNQHFGVNILTTMQTDIAMVFAGMTNDPEQDRFLTGNWQVLKTGAPVLQGALVSLDCALSAMHTHGTHNIYIGRVVDTQCSDNSALVYCNRSFAQISTFDS